MIKQPIKERLKSHAANPWWVTISLLLIVVSIALMWRPKPDALATLRCYIRSPGVIVSPDDGEVLVHIAGDKRVVAKGFVGEDISVPRSAIPAMVRRIQQVSSDYDLPIAVFGHIGDGNLHPNILFDQRNPGEVARVEAAARDICLAAVEMGGTLSGEHGVGLLKRDSLSVALEPGVIALMKDIKRVLDPNNILNPGKIFPTDAS